MSDQEPIEVVSPLRNTKLQLEEQAKITVADNLYFQMFNEDVWSAQIQPYELVLDIKDSEEQPHQKRCKIGIEGVAIYTGWVENPSLIHLNNVGELDVEFLYRGNLLPIVLVAGSSTKFKIHDLDNVTIRCVPKEDIKEEFTRVVVTALPEGEFTNG